MTPNARAGASTDRPVMRRPIVRLIAAYEPVILRNPTRSARSNIEVATLPVAGWLVEVEAAYPRGR